MSANTPAAAPAPATTTSEQDYFLQNLTPEERAAIEDTDDELETLKAIAGDDDDDDDTGADGGLIEGQGADGTPTAAPAAAPAAAEPASAAPAQAPAAAAPAEATDTTDDEPAAVIEPAYRAELPADHAEKKSAAEAALADLAVKFKAGDLDFDEYNEQAKAHNEELRKLEREELKVEIANDMAAQSVEAQWRQAINRQFVAAKGDGIDYGKDEEKRADLDTFVRTLGANPKHADKSMDWFMQEAHKRVLALHDIKPANAPAPAPSASPAASAPTPAPAPAASRKPPVSAVTPSLSNVPGADGPGDLGDEFVELDSLEGLELEAALARMSPAQREKYLQGA